MLGMLYSANTVGAVIGCLLAGFYLLRVFDMAHRHLRGRRHQSHGRTGQLLARQIARPQHHAGRRCQACPRQGRLAGLRHHRPLRRHRPGRGGHLDPPARPHARRHRLHLLHHSGCLPGRASASAAAWAPPWCAAPATPRRCLGWCQMLLACRRRLDRLHALQLPALLARQSAALHQPLVHLPDRYGALPVGHAAGRAALGRQLPARPGRRCQRRGRPRPPRRRHLRRQYLRRHPRRAQLQPDPGAVAGHRRQPSR